jgi:hypothetical protein
MPRPIWFCKIGTREDVTIGVGQDTPMRRAVEEAFERVAGVESEFLFSGWSAALTEPELAVVEKRWPSEEHYREERVRNAAPDLLAALEGLLDSGPTGEQILAARHAARAALSSARGEG